MGMKKLISRITAVTATKNHCKIIPKILQKPNNNNQISMLIMIKTNLRVTTMKVLPKKIAGKNRKKSKNVINQPILTMSMVLKNPRKSPKNSKDKDEKKLKKKERKKEAEK